MQSSYKKCKYPDSDKYLEMKIGIVGLGYVGLPLAIAFGDKCEVVGFDLDPRKIELLNKGQSYIDYIEPASIAVLKEKGFFATDDFSHIADVDAVVICVPTPLDAHREPDLSFVENTCDQIAPFLMKGTLVSLESTTYPGTTKEVVRPILEKGSGLITGVDYYLSYSPEREDPGNPDSKLQKIPKVVGGFSNACLEKAVALYSLIAEKVIPVSSCDVAEATKITENVFRSINIALVNELKVIYEKMGIDVWEVIDAAATKPFGYMPFYPGPGLGGHCIPIDPFYLTWKAREYGKHTRFIELAGEINTSMPEYVIQKVSWALNQECKSLKGSSILLLGMAYKANVDDDRESPSYVLMDLLESTGAKVDYNDPHVPVIRPSREHKHFAGRKSVEITDQYDLILLSTPHKAYKEFNFSSYCIPIVDTRNAIDPGNRPTKYYKA